MVIAQEDASKDQKYGSQAAIMLTSLLLCDNSYKTLMAEQDATLISRIINKVLEYVEPILQSALKTLVENRPVAFFIAAMLIVLAGALGYSSWRRADFYERTVERALSKKTENTPQTYKAIEALILSDVETDEDGKEFSYKEKVKAASISPNFASSIKDMHKILSTNADAPKTRFEVAKPDVVGLRPRSQEEAIITEPDEQGFLFLPVRLLHASDDDYSKMQQTTKSKVQQTPDTILAHLGITETDTTQNCGAGKQVSPLCDDVLTSRRLVVAMKTATTVEVTSDAVHDGIELMPQQVYYITENGLNRIVSQGGNDAIVYRNQFRAQTVFPARPYYSGAFAAQKNSPAPLLENDAFKPTGKLGDYFYVSDPYLDIGGNGLVVTLARAVQYDSHSEGVICFDLRLKEKYSLGTKLTDLLDGLSAAHVPITCTIFGKGDPSCKAEDTPDRQLSDAATNLESMLKNARDNSNGSDVMGGFDFVPLNPTASTSLAGIFQSSISQVLHANHELRFMVPLEPPKVLQLETQEVQLKFLAVSLNVGRYLQNTALLGFSSMFFLGLSFTVLIVAWAGDTRRRALVEEEKKFVESEKRDLHTALDNVSTVMMSSNTPYVRLSDEDRILNANPCLAEFFGFPRTVEAVQKELIKTKFEDWISDPSKRVYHKVQTQRQSGELVEPYELEFLGPNNTTVRAKVISSVVPASQGRAGGLPETFGILVPL
jgi:PAS domain-containing protein